MNLQLEQALPDGRSLQAGRIDKEIVIAGLARDCAHSLPRLLPMLEELADRFSRSHFIFLENDSLDRTKEVFKAFARQHPSCYFESLDGIGRTYRKRTARLAYLRNAVLERAEVCVADPQHAFLLLLDLDDVNSTVSVDYLVNLVENDTGDWAGLFANQADRYYDLWALRHARLCPYDVWRKVRERPKEMSPEDAVARFITAISFSLPPDQGRVEVESAFGGLGLYRLSAISGCRYLGLGDDGHEVCEHVAFNEAVRLRGGRLFIDCALINARGTEVHAPPKTRWQKWKKRLRRLRLV